MDFSRALRLVTDETDDQRWIKILIGGVVVLLGFLIIPGIIITGYQVETMRKAANGEDRLPAWNDWGGYAVRGLLAIAIQLVYALPLLLVACCLGIVASVLNADPNNPNTSATAFLACLGCLAIPLALFAAYVGPAATLRYATTNDVAAGFNFGAVFDFIRANLGPYSMAFLANIVLALAASIVGSILCGVPLPWLAFLASVLGYHLYGQVVRPAAAGANYGDLTPIAPSS